MPETDDRDAIKEKAEALYGEWEERRAKVGESFAGATENVKEYFNRIQVDVNPDKLDDTFAQIREKAASAVKEGRYTKVRLLYKGKQIGPDIPMGVLLAGEVASFWWAGPMRAIIMNLGVKSFLEVEFIHEASTRVLEGVELYMEGEVELAEEKYREALDMKANDTAALYNLAVLLRVTGRKPEAIELLEKAALDEEHPDGSKAREMLRKLRPDT